MAYKAEILVDSINSRDERLTSFELEMPRLILPEFNTHRMFSRNVQSTRAVPVVTFVSKTWQSEIPILKWGANQPGMEAERELGAEDQVRAQAIWQSAKDAALVHAALLNGGIDKVKNETLRAYLYEAQERLGLQDLEPLAEAAHKEVSNPLLIPFSWDAAVVTATDWDNFFGLRISGEARAEIHEIAALMREAMEGSDPVLLEEGEWHMPLIRVEEEDMALDVLKMLSVGRCARVSYTTHRGERDLDKDIGLHDQLLADGHMSPFEHMARPMTDEEVAVWPYSGNFRGWHQYRKELPNEADFSKR